jgi:hypothetical protein
MLLEVTNAAARNLLQVSPNDVGNLAVWVRDEARIYRPKAAGVGAAIWDGDTVSAATTVTAGTNVVTPKVNSYPVNTAVLVLTDAATVATSAVANNQFRVTLTATRILGNPTGLVAGGWYEWEVIQGGTGSYELTYGNLFVFAGGVPALTNTVGAKDVLRGRYNGTHLVMQALLDVKAA